ncbi:hypothetical protein [Consotaella salsifontis]|uniref:DUF1127 domain-containing protein n=1 Tax=Consotaella salsifontis TaxID=1365950 RepID=A0A1T4TA20_9HYPH|nr:hypothetical protein [Consotaella salsifontis]SKA37018.1 hypothetical protein SAMN05428963_12149 [Consotaella salsifontis]
MSAMSRIASFGRILGAARRVSSDIECRRNPDARDLRELGIDPSRFQAWK